MILSKKIDFFSFFIIFSTKEAKEKLLIVQNNNTLYKCDLIFFVIWCILI